VGIGEASLDEAVGDEAAEVGRRLPLHPGGDLFGQEFEQEVGHGQSVNRALSWRQR
jgi:hypothetical protein